MNKVILVGNLTKAPELSETPNGVAVCKFSMAVQRDFTNADGKREADFFNIVVWRERANVCAKYLNKGNKVAVVGALQNRSYEDKEGVVRHITEVVASEVEFLTPKQESEKERPALTEIDDAGIPF